MAYDDPCTAPPMMNKTPTKKNTHTHTHTLPNTQNQGMCFSSMMFPSPGPKKVPIEITSLFPPRIHFHHRRWLHSCFEALALGTVAASADDYPPAVRKPQFKKPATETGDVSVARNSLMKIKSKWSKKRVPRIGIFDHLEPRSSFHHIHLSWLTTRCLS